MKILENLIAAVSPRWAYQREMYRKGLQYMRNYDGARVDRFGEGWTAINASAEQTDAPYRDRLRARARDLERNNDIAGGAVDIIVRNVVGTGIRLQARVRKKDGTYDRELNKKIEKAWKKWIRARNCDITGQQTFYEIEGMILTRRIVDGEIFVIKTFDNSVQGAKLKLQIFEADQLATWLTGQQQSGTYIIGGVEVNENLKPIAYHFNKVSPDGFQTFEAVRIEADRVIHLFHKRRPTQLRGISELARVVQRIKDTGDYMEAELVAARIGACFAAFVETNMPGGGNTGRFKQDSDGKRLETIEPGIIQYLRPGEKVSIANPGRSGANVKDFVQLEQRMAGVGIGLSYELVSRDVSQVNFSSARQNLLEDRKTFRPIQEYMKEHFCREVYTEWLISAVLAGELDIKDFWNDKERYLEHTWITPGWQWIDPLKEVQGAKEELKAGLTTLALQCGEQGEDWEENLEQRALEVQIAKNLGLTLDIDNPEKGGNVVDGKTNNDPTEE